MKQTLDLQSNIKSTGLEKSVQGILLRLMKLAQSKFEVKLEFLFAGDHDISNDWIYTKLKSSQFLTSPTDCYFPIRVENILIGVVHARGELKPSEPKMLMEMVDLIVASTLTAAVDLSTLSALEGKLQLLEPSQNVIRMDQFKQRVSPLLQILTPLTATKKTSRFCNFVYGKNDFERRKGCFNFHEESGNFAFVNINDLADDSFNSVLDFGELGPITVFIPEVGDLTAPMQRFLAEYLDDTQWNKGPSVTFGSRYPFLDPKIEFMIQPDLFLTLKRYLDFEPKPQLLN